MRSTFGRGLRALTPQRGRGHPVCRQCSALCLEEHKQLLEIALPFRFSYNLTLHTSTPFAPRRFTWRQQHVLLYLREVLNLDGEISKMQFVLLAVVRGANIICTVTHRCIRTLFVRCAYVCVRVCICVCTDTYIYTCIPILLSCWARLDPRIQQCEGQ